MAIYVKRDRFVVLSFTEQMNKDSIAKDLVPVVVSKYCKNIDTTLVAHVERQFENYKILNPIEEGKDVLASTRYKGQVEISDVTSLSDPLCVTKENFLGDEVVVSDAELTSIGDTEVLTFCFSICGELTDA